ncbi:MAG: adenosylcobinamide kinase/adenosylcobinamide phosphate guanyltransferase [Candidatus Mycalebacterium zealandia]|nr:MAG: adenosylcobinamide kinase/adenosylcobinamide phosphate guanyltransferase [Candidatus Mycalebacterium zealandia]
MGKKIVLTGGVGSGKSSRALEIAERSAEFSARIFIATATPFDDEMREKIRLHQLERDERFKTVEEPLSPGGALERFADDPRCVAVVDCLTVWLANLSQVGEEQSRSEKEKFCEQFENFRGLVIAVTNETGMGLIPPEKQTRAYANEIATLNRRVVSLCDEAYLLVAGAAVRIK